MEQKQQGTLVAAVEEEEPFGLINLLTCSGRGGGGGRRRQSIAEAISH